MEAASLVIVVIRALEIDRAAEREKFIPEFVAHEGLEEALVAVGRAALGKRVELRVARQLDHVLRQVH